MIFHTLAVPPVDSESCWSEEVVREEHQLPQLSAAERLPPGPPLGMDLSCGR